MAGENEALAEPVKQKELSIKDEIKSIVVAACKEQGLVIAEETAVKLVKVIFKVFPDIFRATKNPFDDLLIPLLAVIEPKVVDMLDKIDGIDNQA